MITDIEATLFNPSNAEFIQNPYPVYEVLRDHDPVHHAALGFWVLTRHEDVVAVLNDTRFSNAPAPYAVVNRRNSDTHVAADVANTIIPFLDPPGHTSSRRLIAIALKAIFDGSRRISLANGNITWTARMGGRWPEALELNIDMAGHGG
jgi:cytochrome P450